MPPIVCSEHTLNVVKRRSRALGQIDNTCLCFVTIALVHSMLALEEWLEVVVRITDVCVSKWYQIDVYVLTQFVISGYQLVDDKASAVRTDWLVINWNPICCLLCKTNWFVVKIGYFVNYYKKSSFHILFLKFLKCISNFETFQNCRHIS